MGRVIISYITSYELPLILSNCVGNIDLVEEEINGFTFENIETIANKVEYKDIFLKRGKDSKRILIEKYNIENMIKNYKSEYQNIKG